ncbi:MAG: serine/threonine protein kinase [Piccolia ochrophora]|nr:MAG: serine/threonine protein kinase [Piccolia ochrophora]
MASRAEGSDSPRGDGDTVPHHPKPQSAAHSKVADEVPSEVAQQQAVRFSSINQEIDPPKSLQTITSLTTNKSQPVEEMTPEAQEELRHLSQSLQDARLQKQRTGHFAFEPVSLPPSRVPSREGGLALQARDSSISSGISPSPTTALQSPPLTPAGSRSLEGKQGMAAGGGSSLAKVHPDPAVVTPQTSPPHDVPPPTSLGRSLGNENDNPQSTSSSRPSSASGQVSTRPTSVSTGPSVVSSHPKQAPVFSVGPTGDSLPQSRDTSPNRTPAPESGTSTPFSRPIAPSGDKDDPYARNKRPPQPRNVEEIDPRFVFGSKEARRRPSMSGRSSPSHARSSSRGRDHKSNEEKRHSHIWKKDQDDPSPMHGKPHGSMSDLKRFFRLGHKHKRAQSPASSLKSSKSGSHTPPHQLPPSTVPFAEDHGLQSKYGRFGKVLGSGAGGSVRLMKRSSDGVTFAVKEFRAKHSYESEREYSKKVTAEFCIGSTLHHGNIIETLDIIHERGKWYEIMEFAPFDLFAVVMTGKMSREEVTCTFLQIVAGVSYLHSMGLAHRDLKLDNVVVNERGIMKLIDFGSAAVFQYPFETGIVQAQGIVGSDPYLAPEVYDNAKYDPQRVDVWSLAIIFCCMALRRFPWKVPRLTDNSYKLFASPPTPGQPTGDTTRRPKSSADIPSMRQPELDPSPNASRHPSADTTGPHHHHRQHQEAQAHSESEPVSHAAGERNASDNLPVPSGGAASQPQQPAVVKGPWRLLRLLPRESRFIVGRMLEIDPRKRATLQEMYTDPWVSNSPVCRQEEGGKVISAEGHTHSLEPETGVAAEPTPAPAPAPAAK